jgi:hypothetical protein
MAKRGFNASIIPLTEEQLELLKLDIWHKKRSIMYKRDNQYYINNFENFKGKNNN